MKQLKVLIGCETSGAVRRAFLERGHDAWSCDLLPAQDRSNRHMQCDVRQVLDMGWDLLAVMHPPCTRLCNSGVRWLHRPQKDAAWQRCGRISMRVPRYFQPAGMRRSRASRWKTR